MLTEVLTRKLRPAFSTSIGTRPDADFSTCVRAGALGLAALAAGPAGLATIADPTHFYSDQDKLATYWTNRLQLGEAVATVFATTHGIPEKVTRTVPSYNWFLKKDFGPEGNNAARRGLPIPITAPGHPRNPHPVYLQRAMATADAATMTTGSRVAAGITYLVPYWGGGGNNSWLGDVCGY